MHWLRTAYVIYGYSIHGQSERKTLVSPWLTDHNSNYLRFTPRSRRKPRYYGPRGRRVVTSIPVRSSVPQQYASEYVADRFSRSVEISTRFWMELSIFHFGANKLYWKLTFATRPRARINFIRIAFWFRCQLKLFSSFFFFEFLFVATFVWSEIQIVLDWAQSPGKRIGVWNCHETRGHR